MKKILSLVILAFVIAMPVLAVNGTTSDPSRTLFSARQLGMGGLTVGFSDDGNGVFSNPAGLTGLNFPQLVTASRKIMMDETQYVLAGWAMPTNYGTFGIGYTGMGTSGSLPTTLDPGNGRIVVDPSSEAGSYASSVLAFSYSRLVPLPIKASAGGNLKLFNQSLSGTGSSDRGTGMGIDLSLLLQPLPWFSAGAILENAIGGSIKWSSTEDKIPFGYKIGAAFNFQELRAGLDYESSNLFHLGLEYFPIKTICLRAGLNQESTGTGLTLGTGFINSGFRFDYAYVQRAGLPGDNPHYFSLSYIGERVFSIEKSYKKRQPAVKFLSPRDRLITDSDSVEVRVESYINRIMDKKNVWTVTGVSETHEVHEISTTETFSKLFLNGKNISNAVSFEASERLGTGRNVFQVYGHISREAGITSEALAYSAEVHVLRFHPFKDTPMHYWAIEPIAMTVTLGMVKGYPDNTFKPETGISRAELVAMLVRTLDLSQEALDKYAMERFSDVPLSHWSNKFITYAVSAKYVEGYESGAFKPNQTLNRAEAAKIFCLYAGLTEESAATTLPFPDLKPGFWANKFIVPAQKAGLLNFLAGKDFKPGEKFTRAEACEMLYQVPSTREKSDRFWKTGLIFGSQF